jgi:carboxymethylenebutenolidase
MIVEEHFADLPTPSGTMRVHAHHPVESAPRSRYPGVVLYSEIYQQTAPIRRAAQRLAGHGFVVAVPEVFHEHEPPGTVLAYDATGTEKGNRYKYGTRVETFDRDARIVLDHLASHAQCDGRLGAIGWCLGGHLALRAAFQPDVRATACFYATDVHGDTLGEGKKSDTIARLPEIRGEIVMVWGRQDPHVPDEGRDRILAAFRKSGVRFGWHEVNAVHAFMRDEGPRYDPSLAALGWTIAFDLFERALRVAT